ncbi:MAG TPA: nuclear transport factor 2 family protein [Acidobacteriaceae bacterium]|jgi:ketosteroid isomerase-like protein|nr:nuclear transport factor 2 family protein [Acidobacteriaceae bacterium]
MEALPLQPAFARAFAQDWIEAWNTHDLDRILAHYDDTVLLTSPVARRFLNGGDTIEGKPALREYFRQGLQAYPDLRFDFLEVLWGIETVVVRYINSVRGGPSAEVMLFNAAGKVTRVWANYDQ